MFTEDAVFLVHLINGTKQEIEMPYGPEKLIRGLCMVQPNDEQVFIVASEID